MKRRFGSESAWPCSRSRTSLLLAALGTVLATTTSNSEVDACGCFAPPLPTPETIGNFAVNQRAEQIIFEVTPGTPATPNSEATAGTIAAHVRILYQGDPDQFAWLLPMPNVPEIELSEGALFSYIDQQTAPLVTGTTSNLCPAQNYACRYHPPCQTAPTTPSPMAAAPAATGSEGFANGDSILEPGTASPTPPVTVLASARVGAYDTVTFAAEEADLAIQWLNDNGFIVNETMSPYMQPYLDAGLVFVASKLIPEANVDEIRPLKLTYVADSPSIPLQLTAIAAEPHLTVTAFIYAAQEFDPATSSVITLPSNELSVATRNNYPMLMARAVDDAGGYAFVKEYVGPGPRFSDPTGCCSQSAIARQELPPLTPLDGGSNSASDAGTSDAGAVATALDGGGSVPIPSTTPAPSAVPTSSATTPDPVPLQDWCGIGGDGACQCPGADFEALDCPEDVAVSVELADTLAQKYPVLTRLTTRISPEEMTLDPVFAPAEVAVGSVQRNFSAVQWSLAGCEAQVVDSESFEEITTSNACSAIYCDWGECVLSDGGAGCRCDEGFVARVFTDQDNQASITCVPETPPVDFAAGGIELPNPCDGVVVEDGACIDLGGFAGVACDATLAAVIEAGSSTPSCRPVTAETSSQGARNYSTALRQLDVCAPTPPMCGSNGWLVELNPTNPGLRCDDVPDPSWFEPTEPPVCPPINVDSPFFPTPTPAPVPVLVDTREPRPGSPAAQDSSAPPSSDDDGCSIQPGGNAHEKAPSQHALWLLLGAYAALFARRQRNA